MDKYAEGFAADAESPKNDYRASISFNHRIKDQVSRDPLPWPQ